MTNYKEMSDFEINKAVAVALGFTLYESENGTFLLEGNDKPTAYTCKQFIPYCNDWAYAGPLMVDNRLECYWTNPLDMDWVAKPANSADIRSKSTNPCRAIAICYLMMKEADK